MKKIRLALIFFLLLCTDVNAGAFLKQIIQPSSQQKIFVSILEEKEQLLTELIKKREIHSEAEQSFEQTINKNIEKIKTELKQTEKILKNNPDDEFLTKKQTLLKEAEAVLKNRQRTREDITSLLDTLISQLQDFIADTEFEIFKKKYRLQERLYNSFEDLLLLHDLILDQERLVTQLADQEKTNLAEKESRKRTAAVSQEECEKRKKDIQVELTMDDSYFINNSEQEKKTLELEMKTCKYKKNLDALKLEEIGYRINLSELKLFIAKTQLDLFKKQLQTIRPSLHVSEADVTIAEDELTKEQYAYFARKDTLNQQRDKIALTQKTKEKELTTLSKEHNIMLGQDVDEWSITPKQSAYTYVTLTTVGALNDEVLALSKEKNLLDAQIVLEEQKFTYKKIRFEAKKTYNKIVSHGFLTEEEITKERNEYDSKKRDAEDVLKLYQSKVGAIANLLNQQKRVIDKIKIVRNEIEKQSDTLFKGKHKDYIQSIKKLEDAEQEVKKQIDILGKTTVVYSGIIAEVNNSIRLVDFIIVELQANTIWHRPAYAISLTGIKNVIPDIKAFLNDVRFYITQFNIKLFFLRITKAFSHLLNTLLFIIAFFILALFFTILKRHKTIISELFFARGQDQTVLIRIFSFIIGTIITFTATFSFSLFILAMIWLMCWMIADSYLYIMLYLLSIPYLLYLSYYFMKLLITLNKEYQYILLPEDYARRFEIICSSLLYISISIFFFRQAFMLSNIYLRSELPTILLAINFIMLQIALIFLITKEQIIGIIPERTDFWRWIRGYVDTYYYFILLVVITVIIMSNPYVGFGRLVLYLLAGLLYTILLIKALLLLHEGVKYSSSQLFFYQDEAIVRERFAYAKTCFGLIIIASFVVLSFICFIATAKIWGWQISFLDIKQWLSQPILLEDTTHPVTTISLLKIILYILSGFTAAYALKQYVLARIFDLLLVESGVQHTVTSIVQYVVIVIAVFIGFKSVGLGELVWFFFTALALSIGLYIKDPISDFISYFIILVQRPVKIGDLIELHPDIVGVVRKITPRSVILRRRNSTTIIIPNTQIVSNAVENWNYVRSFISIGDIFLHIPYRHDAQQVKEIIYQATDSHQNILKNPRPVVQLWEFTDLGYKFMIRAFVSSAHTLEKWEIASDIRLLTAKALREHNIEFAVPIYRYIEEPSQYADKKTNSSGTPFGNIKNKTPKE